MTLQTKIATQRIRRTFFAWLVLAGLCFAGTNSATPDAQRLNDLLVRTAGQTAGFLDEFSDDARLIVSEPLGDVAGVWNEVPESTCVIVSAGGAELRPFRPAPSTAVD